MQSTSTIITESELAYLAPSLSQSGCKNETISSKPVYKERNLHILAMATPEKKVKTGNIRSLPRSEEFHKNIFVTTEHNTLEIFISSFEDPFRGVGPRHA